jgi:hypothetical protein
MSDLPIHCSAVGPEQSSHEQVEWHANFSPEAVPVVADDVQTVPATE